MTPVLAQASPFPQSQSTPMQGYEAGVREGKLTNDEGQRQVIARLQALYELLMARAESGFLKKLFAGKKEKPRSLYIWGAVGRGKSMLMDMFYKSLDLPYTRRVHFHAFMQDVHAMVHFWRHSDESTRKGKEVLEEVAAKIAKQYGTCICLDELQVTDVADAMILSKLFEALFYQKVAFVITSNRPPEELYLGGLQREKFMDFVHLIYQRMDVLELISPHDYRMKQIRAMQTVYLTPNNEANAKALDESFVQLTHQADISPLRLEVQGREVLVPKSYGGIARFRFHDLCVNALGPADYLAIARRFHTVFIDDIPKLTPENRNEARRFVTLIDTLYDHHVKLICTAEVAAPELYPLGDGSFEFGRTASRLAEMQSALYLDSPHIP